MNARNILLIMFMLLLLGTAMSEPTLLYTDKPVYGVGEEVIITSAIDDAVTMTLTDPNGAESVIGSCLGSCTLRYEPQLFVKGAYTIRTIVQGTEVAKTVFRFGARQTSSSSAPVSHLYEIVSTDGAIYLVTGTEDELSELLPAHVQIANYRIAETSEVIETTNLTAVQMNTSLTLEESETNLTAGEMNLTMANMSIPVSIIAPVEHITMNISANASVSQPKVYFNRSDSLSIFDSSGRKVQALIRSAHEVSAQSIGNVPEQLFIEPLNSSMQGITLHDYTERNGTILYLEDIVNTTAFQSYAIDPSELNFSTAEIRVKAKGRQLLVCKEYNFTAQVCTGNFTRVMLITPGQYYTVNITPEDPLFIELDRTFVTRDAYVISSSATSNFNDGDLQFRDRTITRTRSYMSWDYSSLPANIYVRDAMLRLYQNRDGSTASASFYHIYDDTWDGQTETSITYNNQVCGTNFDDAADCNLTAYASVATTGNNVYRNINVTKMLRTDMALGGGTLSIAIKTAETGNLGRDDFTSRTGSAAQQPLLDVTFIYYPNVTLVYPATSYLESQSHTLDLNFTHLSETAANCTLWTNSTGTWHANRTVNNVANGSTQNFTVTLPNGQYKWNVYCVDGYGLTDWASNRTFTIKVPSVSANQSMYMTLETAALTGTDWPASTNVTINLTNASGMESGFPISVITSATGSFSINYTVPLSPISQGFTITSYNTSTGTPVANGTFQVYGLSLSTDDTAYVKNDNVSIFATGFSVGSKVTLTIIDPTQDAALTTNITANATGGVNYTWTIPGSAFLGTYEVNTTQVSLPGRSLTTSFDVSTAVIQTDSALYEQGELTNITGHSWTPGQNVTIRIINLSGYEYLGPLNITANASGKINLTWQVPYEASAADYVLYGAQTAKSDNATFQVIIRPVDVTTNVSWYRTGEIVNISGIGFVPGENVNLDVYNSSSDSVSGYPLVIVANGSGAIGREWTVPGTQADGYYYAKGESSSYSNLIDIELFEIVTSALFADDSAYSSGETVTITGSYFERNGEVTIDIRNSTGTSAPGYPKLVAVDDTGGFVDLWTAVPGSGFDPEDYNISVVETGDASRKDFVIVTVTKSATVFTSSPFYMPNQDVVISGGYYAASGNVNVSIVYLSNGGTSMESPWVVMSDASSNIATTWDTSGYCAGTYMVKTVDQSFPEELSANVSFNITYNNLTQTTCTAQWGFDCGTGPAESGDNTFDGCANGVGNDESVENIYLNATIANPGDNISVTCEYDPYTSQDYLGIWYYNGTGWRELYSEDNMGSASIITRTTYFVVDDNPGTHHVRCHIDYQQNTADECADTGTYYDNDDVSFTVVSVPSSCTEFDATAPDLTSALAIPSATTLGQSVLLSVDVTDDTNISTVLALVTHQNGTTYMLSMSNISATYTTIYTITDAVGMYNVTFWANDTWKNTDTTTINFTIAAETAEIITSQQSYLQGDTVRYIGTGFTVGENISILIINATGSTVSGYPDYYISNNTGSVNGSWVIPGLQDLGTYTINTTSIDTGTSIADTFKIVTAVITAESGSYIQGETVVFSGYSWDTSVDVTVNLTDPHGTVVYGTLNLTSNSSGGISSYWFIPYDAILGNYLLFAVQPTNENKTDSYVIEIERRVPQAGGILSWYKRDDKIDNIAVNFSANSTIIIDIVGPSGQMTGYPINVTSNETGGISGQVSVNGTGIGTHTISMTDLNFTNLNVSVGFEVVVVNATTSQAAYTTGSSVVVRGVYWDRSQNVTLNVTNSTGALVYSANITATANGNISHSFLAPTPNGSSEDFTATLYTSGDRYDNLSFVFSVNLIATLLTDDTRYFQDQNIAINGSYYTTAGDVLLDVMSLDNGGRAEGYPIIVTADGTGFITYDWNLTDSCAGDYIIYSTDDTKPSTLHANTTYSVIYNDPTPHTCFEEWGFDCGVGPAESGDNTFDACANGVGNDESVEEISLNMSIANPGDTVEVTCTFDPYTSQDYLNIWYYNSSGWERIYTEGPMGSASNIERTVSFTVDNLTGDHWIRCMIDYQQNTADECADTGSYYDNDDIHLTVVQAPTSCTLFDNTNPDVTSVIAYPSTTYLGNSIIINASVTDDRMVTSVLGNILYPNGTQSNISMTLVGATYTGSFLDTNITGIYTITIIAEDNSSHVNDSEATTFGIVDILSPKWSSIVAWPSSPVSYASGAIYQFNVTWVDDYQLDEIVIQHNISGSMQNYSVTEAGNVSLYSITDIPAGAYSWWMHASDASGNSNVTPEQTFTILTDATSVNLTIEGNSSNITISAGSSINLSVDLIYPTTKILELYIDGALINIGLDSIFNITTFSTTGVYNVTGRFSGDKNYTKDSHSYYVEVIDAGAPKIHVLAPPNRSFPLNTSFNISVNATDDYAIDAVWIEVNSSFYHYRADMIPDGVDRWRWNATTTKNTVGYTNYTVYVNDTSGSWSSETRWFITLDELFVTSLQDSYIVGDTLTLNGSGFYPYASVSITIWNGSENVSGYPKNLTSDRFGVIADTWMIPGGQHLGSYEINATDTNNASRTAVSNFSIVTAVIDGDKSTYIQGETMLITGYSWDADTNVTLTIKDYSETVVYGPQNTSSNSSGEVNTSWTVPEDAQAGTYTLYAIQPTDMNKNDTYQFSVIEKNTQVETNVSWYKVGEGIGIVGYSLSADVNVSIWILDSSNVTLSGYPVNVTSNSTGGFDYTALFNEAVGLYYVYIEDTAYSNLNATTVFYGVTEDVSVAQSTYNNGDNVTIIGVYYDRLSNVTIDIRNASGDSLGGYPVNVTTDAQGSFETSWIASTIGITASNYTIVAYHNDSKTDQENITVLVAATLQTDKSYYSTNRVAVILGNYYTPSSDVDFAVYYEETGAVVPGSQTVLTANASGGFSTSWNTADYCEGSYRIEAIDQTYPTLLAANATIELDFYSLANDTLNISSYTLDVALNNNNSGISKTYKNDNNWLWFGSKDSASIVDGYYTATFNLSTLGILNASKIESLNVTLEYCHSGLQASAVCGFGAPHEGATNGAQRVQTWDGSAWQEVGELPVDDATDNEHRASWTFGSSAVVGDSVTIRFGLNFTEIGTNDDLLLVDLLEIDVSYREGFSQACTLVDDILGEIEDMNVTSGLILNVTIGGVNISYETDYTDVQTILISNASMPLVSFEHNFTAGPLNMSNITVLLHNQSRAVEVIGHDDILVYVPLVDTYCNTLVCEGVFTGSACTAANYTVYPEAVNGFCLTFVNGTWAEDAPDKTDFTVLSVVNSTMSYEGQTVQLNATVRNDGNTRVRNLTVRFYDITNGYTVHIMNITQLNQNQNEVVQANWSASAGLNNIEVQVDPFNAYGENDETNNNLSTRLSVPAWQTFYGYVSGNLTLGNGTVSAYTWTPSVISGNLFVADADSEISWEYLEGLGIRTDKTLATNDFIELDSALGMTDYLDNATWKFGTDGNNGSMVLFNVYGMMLNATVINSTNSSAFLTGVLWDTDDDANGEYDGSEDVVFTTRINEGTKGMFGTYDYEITVPARLREYDAGVDEVYVYVELQ